MWGQLCWGLNQQQCSAGAHARVASCAEDSDCTAAAVTDSGRRASRQRNAPRDVGAASGGITAAVQAHIDQSKSQRAPVLATAAPDAAHDNDILYSPEDLDMFPTRPKLRWLKALATRFYKDDLRAEFEQDMHERLHEEYEAKQIEVESDCVARIVAVQVTCTNKITELAAQHWSGMDSLKKLVKAKTASFKQMLRQQTDAAYAKGYAMGYKEGASASKAQVQTAFKAVQGTPEHSRLRSFTASLTPSRSMGRTQQRTPPMPVGLLSKFGTGPGAAAGSTGGMRFGSAAATPAAAVGATSSSSAQEACKTAAGQGTVKRLAAENSSRQQQQGAVGGTALAGIRGLGGIWSPGHVAAAKATGNPWGSFDGGVLHIEVLADAVEAEPGAATAAALAALG